ncbi:hypothetical protein LIER_26815 [Lithospermum erythrorhizon]|uniref:Uncharacterized protein n=1 Tax=Lithospermum erythrorhizon TaxID=34254 RepID=A0AAV3RAZ8_LITER
MSRFRRYEIIEESPSCFIHEPSLITPKTNFLKPFCPLSSSSSFLIENEGYIDDFGLNLLFPIPYRYHYPIDELSPLHGDFDAMHDVIQFDNNPYRRRVKYHHHHRPVGLGSELYLQRLCDRVSALELGIGRLGIVRKSKIGARKYSWTTEMKSPVRSGLDRKYKFTAEIKGGRGEISPFKRTYKFESSSRNPWDLLDYSWDKNVSWKRDRRSGTTRLLDITDPSSHHGALVLRQAFARRVDRIRGKRTQLTLHDSAVLIQRTFRAYLIRRSEVLRALRELAIAKNKLKEIRAWFNNFSYRRRVAHDPEERQRFAERIIVLLLTVDALQGVDLMVRIAKRSINYELEAMLEAVDPESSGKFLSRRRRTFDMPDGAIQKELAAGVAQIVQMIDEEC